MRVPCNSPITLKFGAYGEAGYTQDNPHLGTDFAYIPDNIIYAPFSGRVSQGYNDRDGNGSYMTDPQNRFHGMLHASKYLVPSGASVTEGQPIAVMGDTGAAQGIHCHWAVKENGAFIDPMSLIPISLIKEDDMPNEGDIQNRYKKAYGRDATADELEYYRNRTFNSAEGLYNALLNDTENLYNQVEEKNKIIAGLQMVQGDVEANTIGKALIKLFQSFGYKKS